MVNVVVHVSRHLAEQLARLQVNGFWLLAICIISVIPLRNLRIKPF